MSKRCLQCYGRKLQHEEDQAEIRQMKAELERLERAEQHIAELEAENKRLREALQTIADSDPSSNFTYAQGVAKTALSGGES